MINCCTTEALLSLGTVGLRANLELAYGVAFGPFPLTVYDLDGSTPLNLTGLTPRAELFDPKDPLTVLSTLTASVLSGTGGALDLSLDQTTVSKLARSLDCQRDPMKLAWRLFITDAAPPRRAYYGDVKLWIGARP